MRRLAVLLLVATAACSNGDEQAAPTTTTSTTSSTSSTTSTAATTTTTTTALPAASGTPSCPTIPPRAEPPADRPRYTLRVDVRPADNAVVGDVTVRFTPDLDTDRLVFRLWPNGPRSATRGAELAITSVAVDGKAATSEQPNATTLVVPTQVPAGRTVEAAVGWRLTLPGAIEDRISRNGDAIRLGSFYPVLAWERGHGWAIDAATSGFAESSTPVTADYTATITVPAGLDVMATGEQREAGTWTAANAPDFALSVGHFRTAAATAHAPDPVQVSVGVHAGLRDNPAAYVERIVRSLEDFSRRFGPYPWPTLSFALTPNLGGGIEYPMHVMQGPNTLGRTTPHEVGHQWFYALVGSNQGRDPWLDEGLATYAEARFENTLASFRTRRIPAAGRGRTAEPMTYWESRQSIYYRSVYVQGMQAVAALGIPDLVDCMLRVYVARNAYRVARPADLVAAAAAVFPNGREVLARYGIRP